MPDARSVSRATGPSFVLRPWREADAKALADAWSDPAIRQWTVVPEVADLAAAHRWIAGWEERRRLRLSLDLVAADPEDDRVLGEVGLTSFQGERRTARIGWWTAREERGQGVAAAVVSALTDWAHDGPLGLRVVIAEIGHGNQASIAVARRAGYRPLGPIGDSPTSLTLVSEVEGQSHGDDARV